MNIEWLLCPRCKKATDNLHEDDGLCPKCEAEWVKQYTVYYDELFSTELIHADDNNS